MIRYALTCENAHGFEAWFRSADDYDGQAARGLVTCPSCGSDKVGKALMAPRVVTSERAADQSMPAAIIPPEAQEALARLRELKAALLAQSEDVGAGFAEEARRIHYGEAPPRQVHGAASLADARSLVEEGIDIIALPVFPDERN